MRRRRRRHHHRRSYRRSNPLTTSEYVVGGLVAAAVLGVGGYLLYKNSSANALPAGTTAAGGVTSVATDANGNTLINGYPVAPSS
jgi:hypothetical protein